MATRTRTNRRAARRQCIGAILSVLILCFAAAELPAKTPTAAEFPGLAANFKPFDPYVCANSISVGGTVAFDSAVSKKACSLIGAEARILTF